MVHGCAAVHAGAAERGSVKGYDVQIDPSGEIVAVLHEDGHEVDRIPAPIPEAEQIGQEWIVSDDLDRPAAGPV